MMLRDMISRSDLYYTRVLELFWENILLLVLIATKLITFTVVDWHLFSKTLAEFNALVVSFVLGFSTEEIITELFQGNIVYNQNE